MNSILKEKEENIPLAQLYQKFHKDIFKYSFSILRNREEAEDAAQETFVKYAEHESSFKRKCSQKTWLLIITRNYCYNRLKSKNFSSINLDENLSRNFNPDYELNMSLEDAIKKLSAEYNELIYLKDYEGYTYKEISELTKLSVENVKIKLFRARQQLRKFLKGEF